MQKPLISSLYFLSLLASGFTIRQAFAERSPAVESITEISIEENQTARSPGQVQTGFDFSNSKKAQQKTSAYIATKTQNPTYSFLGPLIFLIALPLALWIIIFKKMKNSSADKKIDYYPKTFQFKSPKTNYQENDEDDDQDYPKAS